METLPAQLFASVASVCSHLSLYPGLENHSLLSPSKTEEKVATLKVKVLVIV